ncbi:ORF948 [White spot syndrome virus]|uniref:ORF948 n=1 Tax=White spot syndrome virus TaxID=342409 RepID=A0A2D3I5S8_9VIRU|nr:ORF948 [White spot syndrome virus]
MKFPPETICLASAIIWVSLLASPNDVKSEGEISVRSFISLFLLSVIASSCLANKSVSPKRVDGSLTRVAFDVVVRASKIIFKLLSWVRAT